MTRAAKPKSRSTQLIGIYLRISQDRAGEGESVERHQRECERVAKRIGGKIVDTYVDNDKSASSGKRRPEYERLLADIQNDRITIVVAWHYDRLHRLPIELENYIDICEPRGVLTHFAQAGPIDLVTASGQMMARQHAIIARFETQHFVERLKSQQAEAAANGEWMGGTRPFGWGVSTGAVRKDGTPIYNMYEVVPEEAAEVLRLTRAVIAGEKLGALVRDLNERGIQTTGSYQREPDGTRRPGHPPWSYATLRQVLMRKRNIGLLEYQGETYPGKWPAIVPEDEYHAVCTILTDPSRRLSLSNATKWVGAGLYLCGTDGCGLPLKSAYVTDRTKRRRRIYRCIAGYRPTRGDRANRGGHVHRNADPIDALIVGGEIDGQYTEGVVVEWFRKHGLNALTVDKTARIDRKALQNERNVLRARLEEADDMWAAGDWDRARHARQTKKIQARIDEITDMLAPRSAEPVLRDLAAAPDPATVWALLPLADKRRIISAVMTVTVQPIGRGYHSRVFDPRTVDIRFHSGNRP